MVVTSPSPSQVILGTFVRSSIVRLWSEKGCLRDKDSSGIDKTTLVMFSVHGMDKSCLRGFRLHLRVLDFAATILSSRCYQSLQKFAAPMGQGLGAGRKISKNKTEIS